MGPLVIWLSLKLCVAVGGARPLWHTEFMALCPGAYHMPKLQRLLLLGQRVSTVVLGYLYV